MRGFETTIRIKAGIIGDEVKIAVSERAAGGIKIEPGSCLCESSGGSAMLIRVELEDEVAVQVFGCFKLEENVFVTVAETID